LIHNENPIVLYEKNFQIRTDKSVATAPCKEMTFIPVNKVVGEKKSLDKRIAEAEERHLGSLTQKNKNVPNTFCKIDPW
jgi:hypothetical protein